MRTDGVDRRESAGAGRVVLEVARRVTGAAYSDNAMEPLMRDHTVFSNVHYVNY